MNNVMRHRYIVTITPPTPNGDLHLGHLSGPFLAADVCARLLKQQGADVVLLSYSDDYQSYMCRKAHQLRKEPFQLARYNSRQIQLSMEASQLAVDHFLQASDSPAFARHAERYYRLVESAGQLGRRSTKVFHCRSCSVYGYEGLGRGRCNWCGASSDASQCEDCARAPDVNHMHEMQCMLCQGAMAPVEVERWVWSLGMNFQAVKERLMRQPMRPALRQYLEEMLAQAGAEWAITRPGDAGLPIDGLPGQPLHTWFMGLAGYRAALEEFLQLRPERGGMEGWWHRDTTLVHFLGFDCSYSHALGYAALQTLDEAGPPPGIFITNRFLKLDGEDFSTSRGHAVWIREITGQHPIDAIRLFTALHSPENDIANFDRLAFEKWRADVFDRLVAQVMADLHAPSAALDTAPSAIGKEADAIVSAWHRAADLQQFSIRGMASAVLALGELIQAMPALLARRQYWPLFRSLLAPLCPDLAAEMTAMAGAVPRDAAARASLAADGLTA